MPKVELNWWDGSLFVNGADCHWIIAALFVLVLSIFVGLMIWSSTEGMDYHCRW